MRRFALSRCSGGMEGRPISAYISSKTGESSLSTGSTSARMRRMGWPPGTFWSGVMDVNVACRVVLPRIALLLSGSPSTLTDHELIRYRASPFFSTLLVTEYDLVMAQFNE